MGLAGRKVSVWPERSGLERQGDRPRVLGCVSPVTVFASVSSFLSRQLAAVY